MRAQKLFNLIALVLCGAVGVASFFIFSFSVKSDAPVNLTERDCVPYHRIKVGEHMLTLPRAEGRLSLDKEGKSVLFSCEGKIVEASGIFYIPNNFLKISGVAPTSAERKSVVIELTVSHLSDLSKKGDTYTRFRVEEELTKAGLKIEDLPLDEGFYKFSYGQVTNFYIAAHEDMKTPLGNPVTFRCDGLKNIKCGTGTYWKGGLAIGMGTFMMDRLPIKEWKKAYHGYLKYLESVEEHFQDFSSMPE